jgi:hypothetical protein
MTIRSSTSAQRYTNRERIDKEQDSRNNDFCRKGEQNDRFPVHTSSHDGARHVEGRNFRGRSGDCVLHEQIVILSLPAKCYQKNKGLVSTSSRCIKKRSLFSRVVVRRRIVVSSWSSFPNTQT